jgi:hypothetical protein
MKLHYLFIGISFSLIIILVSGYVDEKNQYPLHKDITVTTFWVGEKGTDENGYIPNDQSAWDTNWIDHYGGIDDPYNRNGSYPKNFIPKENPFYFALPYNDFDENGRKSSQKDELSCKNRWIRIIKGNKVAYAQWEDVGPFGEDDVNYVFGNSEPQNKINNNAGLDVSPAVRDYLGLEDIDIVEWQFVDFKDVPNGPWNVIITTSQTYWK